MQNKVFMTGEVLNQPRLVTTATGKVYADIRIVNKATFNDKEVRNCFFARAWNQVAISVCGRIQKGDVVDIAGRLCAFPYTDKTGAKCWGVSINAYSVDVVDEDKPAISFPSGQNDMISW